MTDKETDYRKVIEGDLRYFAGGTYPADRLESILNGYAKQAVREDREKRAEHQPDRPDYRGIFTDSLVTRGYTRYRAAMLVSEWHDWIAARVLKDSDHESYRVVADAVGKLIHEVSDPDDWDGDDSEEYLVCQFLAWLPDIVRHADAEKIRQMIGENFRSVRSVLPRAFGQVAESIDPFERDGEGRWTRKSDGVQVPWNVVKE